MTATETARNMNLDLKGNDKLLADKLSGEIFPHARNMAIWLIKKTGLVSNINEWKLGLDAAHDGQHSERVSLLALMSCIRTADVFRLYDPKDTAMTEDIVVTTTMAAYLHDGEQQRMVGKSGEERKFMHGQIQAIFVATQLMKHQFELNMSDRQIYAIFTAIFFHSKDQAIEGNETGYRSSHIRDLWDGVRSNYAKEYGNEIEQDRPWLTDITENLKHKVFDNFGQNLSDVDQIVVSRAAERFILADEMDSLVNPYHGILRVLSFDEDRPFFLLENFEEMIEASFSKSDFGRMMVEIYRDLRSQGSRAYESSVVALSMRKRILAIGEIAEILSSNDHSAITQYVRGIFSDQSDSLTEQFNVLSRQEKAATRSTYNSMKDIIDDERDKMEKLLTSERKGISEVELAQIYKLLMEARNYMSRKYFALLDVRSETFDDKIGGNIPWLLLPDF